MTDQADQLYERVLVLRCQAGDEAAFAELVARYHARLRSYARKMLGERHSVEDVSRTFGSTYFVAWRGWPILARSRPGFTRSRGRGGMPAAPSAPARSCSPDDPCLASACRPAWFDGLMALLLGQKLRGLFARLITGG
jgi:hypothetical protein